jgi:hypothetical protein
MGRLRHHPLIDREALMPRIREMAGQGCTQEAIAVEVGVAPSTVQKWLYAESDHLRRRPKRLQPG